MRAVGVALKTTCKPRNQQPPNKIAAADIWSNTVTKGMADIAGYWLEILIQIWHRAENWWRISVNSENTMTGFCVI